MATVVLDASAVLAVVKDEAGGEHVLAHLGNAAISAVNLQEVVLNLLRDGVELATIRTILAELRLDVRAHGVEDAYLSATLVQQTARHGQGLGARACIALAMSLGLPVLTADRAWKNLAIEGLRLEHIR